MKIPENYNHFMYNHKWTKDKNIDSTNNSQKLSYEQKQEFIVQVQKKTW